MTEVTDKDIQIFINAMKECSCYDFSNYSFNSLRKRIARILTNHDMEIPQLGKKLREDRNFRESIAKSITVCTTELFRDTEMWISLKSEMLQKCSDKTRLKIWHAGCSTGQEVYSMMIILNEANLFHKCDIYATDLNQDALDNAALGNYKYAFNKNYLDNFEKVINDSSGNELMNNRVPYEKYFTIDVEKDEIQMRSFLTNKPVYKKFDLVRDENPFNIIFDVIICRNVIIYFNSELKTRVLDLLYRNLSGKGCLLMGSHERITAPYNNFFENKFHGYFKKTSI